MEVPSLKEGNVNEIKCLYDVLLQHYRAIKAMDQDNFNETLLMVIIELKLDATTMRDWQHSSREHREVLPFEDLLDFLTLQARDMKNSVRDFVKKHPTVSNPGKRMTIFYAASKEDSCVACKKDNHPLYGCKSFIALSPEKRMELVQDSRFCINCLKSGHWQSNAFPPRNARSAGDHTIPHPIRIGQRNPRCLGNPHSLHRLEKTPQLLQNIHHNRAAKGKCCS